MSSKDLVRFVLLIVLVVGTSGFSLLASEQAPSLTVKGEVVMISGELQVVETPGGKRQVATVIEEVVVLPSNETGAVTLFVDTATHLPGEVSIGDKIEADVNANGRAFSIRKVS
ncbi:MAG: hypothetical protein ACT4OO_11675 [Nitrospiraceae bacterium]